MWAGFHFCLHLVVRTAADGSSRPFRPQKAAYTVRFFKGSTVRMR
ncbi:hypothetical protein FAEPRAA2165_02889 [Faecalibacterium duncaniae]|uniref:Uncharacterized protein n=1 Tax=Faecalibacterium duncaniae (strain DSM 17677 / JCM 31915 / A2-165) TaxID=411483 RepID=C7H992_FAED2|nr:hypothetical protein FAEPRAA2165_02889 [Faecalibacterium duncaniae]